MNETLKTILKRRSTRSYRQEQIGEDELQAVLQAAQYAPNAGDQAWHFTVVQNRALLERLNAAAKEAAAQSGMEQLRQLGENEHFNCLYGAPTLVIISGDGQAPMPLDADCAAAAQNILLAAESVGLASCWIYFVLLAFSSAQGPQLREELQIPEGYNPTDSVVLGYAKGAPPTAEDRKPGLVTYIR